MMTKRKICVVTRTRAEYSILDAIAQKDYEVDELI